MIKFIEGVVGFLLGFGFFFFLLELLWSLSLLNLDIQDGKKKKKKEHVINKELKLGELIKYEYHSKELNVS